MGFLEKSRPPPFGSGVGAAFGAEKFGGGQLGRQRGHVHRNKRPGTTSAGRVQGARHQLLAGAGRAAHQNRNVEIGHLGNCPSHFDEARAVTHHSPSGQTRIELRIEAVQHQQNDAAQQQQGAFLQVFRRQEAAFFHGFVVDHQGGRAAGPADRQTSGRGANLDPVPAQAGVGQGPQGTSGSGKCRLEPGNPADLPDQGQHRQQRPLSHPARIGVPQKGQAPGGKTASAGFGRQVRQSREVG